MLAIALDLLGAFRAASGSWALNPVHFAERHALFVIISLGEAMVAIGATASAAGLDGPSFVGLLTCALTACALWWSYFAYIPEVVEHRIRIASGPERGRIARDLFTLGHFPIVAGLIAFAIVAKHTVKHPSAPLAVPDRVLFSAAIFLIIGGYLAMQWRVVRRLAPERIVLIVAVAALQVLAGNWAAAHTMWATAALLMVALTITWNRYRSDPYVAD